MIEEYKDIKQEMSCFRRFFSGPDFDLMIWYSQDRIEITGYQIAYDKKFKEKVYTKKIENGKVVRSNKYNDDLGSSITSILKNNAGKVEIALIDQVKNEIMSIDECIAEYIERDIVEIRA